MQIVAHLLWAVAEHARQHKWIRLCRSLPFITVCHSLISCWTASPNDYYLGDGESDTSRHVSKSSCRPLFCVGAYCWSEYMDLFVSVNQGVLPCGRYTSKMSRLSLRGSECWKAGDCDYPWRSYANLFVYTAISLENAHNLQGRCNARLAGDLNIQFLSASRLLINAVVRGHLSIPAKSSDLRQSHGCPSPCLG